MPSHKDQAGCGVGTVVRASAVSAVLTETEPWHRPHRLKKECSVVNTGTVSVCVQALWLDEWSAIFLLELDSATDNRARSSSGSNHRNCLLVPQEAICRTCGGMLILQAAWPPAACPCDWLQKCHYF